MRKRKYKKSINWYQNKYKEYLKSADDNIFDSEDDFITQFKYAEELGNKHVLKDFIYESNYEISFTTYKAETELLKANKVRYKTEELLNMSTREFAEKYKDLLSSQYWQDKAAGYSGKDAGLLISAIFFGSEI